MGSKQEKPKQAIALSYDPLSRLEIGDAIPPELYEAVAEILVFVDAMDKIRAKMNK